MTAHNVGLVRSDKRLAVQVTAGIAAAVVLAFGVVAWHSGPASTETGEAPAAVPMRNSAIERAVSDQEMYQRWLLDHPTTVGRMVSPSAPVPDQEMYARFQSSTGHPAAGQMVSDQEVFQPLGVNVLDALVMTP